MLNRTLFVLIAVAVLGVGSTAMARSGGGGGRGSGGGHGHFVGHFGHHRNLSLAAPYGWDWGWPYYDSGYGNNTVVVAYPLLLRRQM